MMFDNKQLCQWIFWTCFLTGTVSVEKRLLLNDPDIVSTLQQMTLEMQKLRADVSVLQQETSLLKNAKTYRPCFVYIVEIIGGGYYTHKGAPANYVCLPHDPDLIHGDKVQFPSEISGMYAGEYQDNYFGNNLYQNDPPCAVCRATGKTSVIMIPGKTKCYGDWHQEYYGRLAAVRTHTKLRLNTYASITMHNIERVGVLIKTENYYMQLSLSVERYHAHLTMIMRRYHVLFVPDNFSAEKYSTLLYFVVFLGIHDGNKSLYQCTYYRSPSDKGESLEKLGISLNRVLCKKTKSNIWVCGDFNLGHIDWNTPAVVPSKPNASLHQQLLDILNDNNLTQVINKNTRNDTTLDLLCMTNPSFVETLPPIGASDNDIVCSKKNLALPQNKQQAHKI
ncbi:unnamed protein product [Mytilus coruscus]|uniref:Endonuclease/exonuclease/phosphatase domain-containing protein n=1 Tax=Mytilus coruscus TaxID=42192 RepID=A0A6J8DZU0_MYTCO|nr:unnamed protein product [Mytilus coruscus]